MSGVEQQMPESIEPRTPHDPKKIFDFGERAQVHSVIPSVGAAVADESFEVVIEGREFGPRQRQSGVFFQGFFEHVEAKVLEWSDRRIRVVVPSPGRYGRPQVLTGSVKVWTLEGLWSDGSEWGSGARYHVLFQFPGDSWDDAHVPIDYYVSSSGSDWQRDILEKLSQQAAEVWHQVPHTYVRYRYRGAIESKAVRKRDQLNVVGWTSPWPHPDNWLAVTWSGIDSLSGERIENDVEINAERNWSVSDFPINKKFDLLSTLVHELGHWLRLGHVQEADHVMGSFQSQGVLRRELGVGDIQGATWIYPTFGRVELSTEVGAHGKTAPGTVILDVQVADRIGSPVAGIPADRIHAEVEILEWITGSRTTTSALAKNGGLVFATGPTDETGRTQIAIPVSSGWAEVRFKVTAREFVLRDRPQIRLLDSPLASPPLVLMSMYPNPLHGGPLRAVLQLSRATSRLQARVFDARGRVVKVAHDGPAPAGEIELDVNFKSGDARLSPGIYILEVRTENARQAQKFVLLGG